MAEEYEGWRNWETWNMALIVDNDFNMYQRRVEFFKQNPVTEETVKDFLTDMLPNGTEDMYEGSMTLVDFSEIAEHWELDMREH